MAAGKLHSGCFKRVISGILITLDLVLRSSPISPDGVKSREIIATTLPSNDGFVTQASENDVLHNSFKAFNNKQIIAAQP